MANPYPGMNPYLENPADWPTVHSALIHNLWAQLRQVLPPGYSVKVEERLYIEESDRELIADVGISERPERWGLVGGETAIIDVPLVVHAAEVKERYLNVVRKDDRARIVTSIEVLSPSNKRNGSGRSEYQQKQRALLHSETNFLEIDLLRAGQHTLAVPKSKISVRYDYLISLHRVGGGLFEIWPTTLRERLPRVAVPLDFGDPDVGIDVNLAVNRFYEEGQMDYDLRYELEPTPPLSAEDAAWSDQLLRAAGLRH